MEIVYVYRRVDTGRIVTADFARRYPHLTYRDSIVKPSPLAQLLRQKAKKTQ